MLRHSPKRNKRINTSLRRSFLRLSDFLYVMESVAMRQGDNCGKYSILSVSQIIVSCLSVTLLFPFRKRLSLLADAPPGVLPRDGRFLPPALPAPRCGHCSHNSPSPAFPADRRTSLYQRESAFRYESVDSQSFPGLLQPSTSPRRASPRDEVPCRQS